MIRRGFTLLEVVLTLAMAVMLMTLIGVTLQFYARDMNVRNMDVRRVQLASSVMQMISDDLRATLYAEAFDASALETFLAGSLGESMAAAIDPAASATLGLDDPSALASEATTEDPAETDEAVDLMSSMMTLEQPGLIGSQSQVQFDISRLPRVEQWRRPQPGETGEVGELIDIPSDIKSVTYFIQPEGYVGGVSDPLQAYLPQDPSLVTAPGGTIPAGLVRRELDRAANKWAVENGGMTRALSGGDLVATEVTAIEFAYFDGLIWQLAWDSDQMQGLPLAIRVTLTLSGLDGTATQPDDGAVAVARTFTQIIQLPAGRLPLTNDPLGTTGTTGGAL